MNHFKIKVCGITRIQDAITATELGAEFIGMIFYGGSPRCLTIDAAKVIAASTPHGCQKVGVFVDEPIDAILRIVDRAGLDAVQIDGDYSESAVDTLQKTGLTVVRGFHITCAADYEPVMTSKADYVLIDNRTGDLRGGTGKPFDWSLEPPHPISNLVLAGGLDYRNVAEGVTRFNPAIVDVNSGVEHIPGVKSVEKLNQFFQECNRIRHGK